MDKKEQAIMLYLSGVPIEKICKELKISKYSLFKYLKEEKILFKEELNNFFFIDLLIKKNFEKGITKELKKINKTTSWFYQKLNRNKKKE